MTKRARRTKPAPGPSKPRTPRGLTARELRFIEQYLVDLNAKQAAIRAGYSAKTAKQQGSRLLTRVDVAARVKQALDGRATRTGITADRVLAELEELAFSDVGHYEMNPVTGSVTLRTDAPKRAMRAVAGVKHRKIPYGEGGYIHEIEIKLWSKPDALKLAGRHVDVHGFYDRVEHTGKDGRALFRPVKELTDEELRAELVTLCGEMGIQVRVDGE